MTREGPKWGREVLFPANPDLADILGRTDFDFENFYFFDFLDPKFADFQGPRNLAWAGLGPGLGRAWAAWAGPGLGRASALGRGGPRVGFHAGFPRVSHGFPMGRALGWAGPSDRRGAFTNLPIWDSVFARGLYF